MFWTSLFPLIYLYTVIDGFFSNLFYPAKMPYLYKDILILVTFFFFFINEHSGRWTGLLRRQLGGSVWMSAMLFLLIGFFQMFNPLSPGLLIGILGFKVIYFYWILALMAFVYFDSYEKIMKFMDRIFVFSVPVNIFGLAQYVIGPALLYQVFGPKPHVRIDIAAVGDYSYEQSFLRVIGTFGSSGQYGNFLVINAIFGFLLLFSNYIPRRKKWIYAAMQGLNFVALLASGSRSSFIFIVLTMILFYRICRQMRVGGVTLILAGLIMLGGFKLLGSRVVERYQSLGQLDQVQQRTAKVTAKMYFELLEKYPMGRGLGSASTAATHLGKFESAGFQLIENYPSKLQSEVGAAGVLCYYLFIFALTARLRDYWLRFVGPREYMLACMLASYLFVQFWVAGVFFIVDSPPVPIFLWTFVGMIARMADPSWAEPNQAGNETGEESGPSPAY